MESRGRGGGRGGGGGGRGGDTLSSSQQSGLLKTTKKKKVLVAPALSLSLGRSESMLSEDFPPAFLSPDEDFDLDGMETPSDSESLCFPVYELDLEDDLRRLGVATRRRAEFRSGPRSRFEFDSGSSSAAVGGQQEDVVDPQGTRWRCFSTGGPESRVNMSVLQPYLRVLSHGGYYGDGMNDIIVFASCYLPKNSLVNYQQVMDHLFRYVVGTLDLMVRENYLMQAPPPPSVVQQAPPPSVVQQAPPSSVVQQGAPPPLCCPAGGSPPSLCFQQAPPLPLLLRKNLKGFYVVHPTWYIKALATIIKPFIRSDSSPLGTALHCFYFSLGPL
ncbi:Bcl-2/adenovirus E1B 19 kDa-interacting protein 2-like protein [Dissostichus eleginoides]|uniref:Bcl-2/adenovirus E1B 19 kDa-interacting protein 2-like protein n=1 Tax=Dissostichus eleginoides TaxID=100907 RepID=A0AAD9B3S1_DISEL|nr:Bcl-2/adenovirus E1B 19 kDa-interacting protein 2-like protein [Dissostichus eleginoides]